MSFPQLFSFVLAICLISPPLAVVVSVHDPQSKIVLWCKDSKNPRSDFPPTWVLGSLFVFTGLAGLFFLQGLLLLSGV